MGASSIRAKRKRKSGCKAPNSSAKAARLTNTADVIIVNSDTDENSDVIIIDSYDTGSANSSSKVKELTKGSESRDNGSPPESDIYLLFEEKEGKATKSSPQGRCTDDYGP